MTDRSGRDRRQAGKRQRSMLRGLGSHGVWSPGCGWGAGAADRNTEGVLRTLVMRGEVTTNAAPGRAPTRWWLTALGYAWLVHDAAHDMGMVSIDSKAFQLAAKAAAGAVAQAQLASALGGPVNWKGELV
jgi:hypothetical protein